MPPLTGAESLATRRIRNIELLTAPSDCCVIDAQEDEVVILSDEHEFVTGYANRDIRFAVSAMLMPGPLGRGRSLVC